MITLSVGRTAAPVTVDIAMVLPGLFVGRRRVTLFGGGTGEYVRDHVGMPVIAVP
ncbi:MULTISPECIES: hypothetical protein [unclassified Pseudonocardia]|uniref:hypothetical protein n=1 Tax=unclassified Pseudonocardia TaxID=2619320 RepID=UPI001CF6BCFE|nr:hypothetical protein [Pseudonocardia sp. ICBG601]